MTRIEDGPSRHVQGCASVPVHVTNDDSISVLTDSASVVSIRNQQLDAAGRLLVAEPAIIFDSTSTYDTSPLIWQAKTSGANNLIAHNTQMRDVTLILGGTNAGYVVSQTYEYVPYQPWRCQEVVLTGVFEDAVAGVTKRIGYFDAKNGLFFQQDGDGTLSVVRRTSTSGATIDNKYPQQQWNLKTLSQLDPSKSWVMAIRFLYLGVAIVQWGIYLDGELQLVHQELLANTVHNSYMQYATLPLRYEMSCDAPATASMIRICSAVNSSGGFSGVPGYRFSVTRETPVAATPEIGLVAIRPALQFPALSGIINRALIRIAGIDVLAVSNPVRWRLLYYPPGTADPTTGGAWAQGTNSAVESKIGMTALSLVGAYQITAGFVAAGSGVSNRASVGEAIDARFPLTLDASGANSPLASAAGDNPAYLVLSALQVGGNATAAGIMEWTEDR